jgi:hypothetical protein
MWWEKMQNKHQLFIPKRVDIFVDKRQAANAGQQSRGGGWYLKIETEPLLGWYLWWLDLCFMYVVMIILLLFSKTQNMWRWSRIVKLIKSCHSCLITYVILCQTSTFHCSFFTAFVNRKSKSYPLPVRQVQRNHFSLYSSKVKTLVWSWPAPMVTRSWRVCCLDLIRLMWYNEKVAKSIVITM